MRRKLSDLFEALPEGLQLFVILVVAIGLVFGLFWSTYRMMELLTR